jgi:hypothetical protein
MMPEYCVDYTHQGQSAKLDFNNGYVYDRDGRQIAKLEVKDKSKDQTRCDQVAGYCFNEVYGRKGVIDSAVASGQATMMSLRSGSESARQYLSARGLDAEKLVAMDLSVGDVHQPTPLPNYSAGYRNEPPVADMYAPPLLVDQISGKYYTWDKDDAFQPATPMQGGAYANVPEIAPRVANSNYATQKWAMGGFVPVTIESAADAALKVRLATAKRVMNAMLIEREKRVSVLATTSGTWDSSVVATLGATFNWNGGSASDPVKDLHTRLEASLIMPTCIIMNFRVWHAFVRNPAVQKYFTYKSNTDPIPSPTQMSPLLDLPPIYVARMRWKTAVAPTYDFIWPDSVVLARQPERMPPVDQEDIASAVTFRWNAVGAPREASVQSSTGGFIVREFYNQFRGDMGGTQIVILAHDQEIQTAKFVGGLINSVIQ